MIKKIPLRKCTGCLLMKEKRQLIRIVKSNSIPPSFAIDLSGKMAGRGAYICNNLQCFEKAFKNKGLERSFKLPVPKDVYNSLRNEMTINE